MPSKFTFSKVAVQPSSAQMAVIMSTSKPMMARVFSSLNSMGLKVASVPILTGKGVGLTVGTAVGTAVGGTAVAVGPGPWWARRWAARR